MGVGYARDQRAALWTLPHPCLGRHCCQPAAGKGPAPHRRACTLLSTDRAQASRLMTGIHLESHSSGDSNCFCAFGVTHGLQAASAIALPNVWDYLENALCWKQPRSQDTAAQLGWHSGARCKQWGPEVHFWVKQMLKCSLHRVPLPATGEGLCPAGAPTAGPHQRRVLGRMDPGFSPKGLLLHALPLYKTSSRNLMF